MSFFNISECCLRGSKLPGEPKGEMQTVAENGLRVDRYVARPEQIVHPKSCIVLLYDIFGFSIHNPKILADTYAAHLGVEVFVPDYIPNPPPSDALNGVVDMYPGENKRGFLSDVWNKLWVVKILPYAWGLLDGRACPLLDKAMEDLEDEGYTNIGAVGYCRGGSMCSYLLAQDPCPISAAAIFHPAYDPERYPLFKAPAAFLLSEQDPYIYGKRVDELKKRFAELPNEVVVFKDTVHGFAARPAFEHAGTMKAFQEANGRAEAFLSRNMGLQDAARL